MYVVKQSARKIAFRERNVIEFFEKRARDIFGSHASVAVIFGGIGGLFCSHRVVVDIPWQTQMVKLQRDGNLFNDFIIKVTIQHLYDKTRTAENTTWSLFLPSFFTFTVVSFCIDKAQTFKVKLLQNVNLHVKL